MNGMANLNIMLHVYSERRSRRFLSFIIWTMSSLVQMSRLSIECRERRFRSTLGDRWVAASFKRGKVPMDGLLKAERVLVMTS